MSSKRDVTLKSIQEELYGPDRPELADTLCDLGTACGSLGDLRRQVEVAQTFDPVRINSHSGNDYWRVEEAAEIFSKAALI